MQSEILKAKQSHPTWGYRRIAKLLGVSVGIVRYYLNPQEKQKGLLRTQKRRNQLAHILKIKKDCFQMVGGWRAGQTHRTRKACQFSLDEFRQKLETNPRCYLTGRPINLLDKKSYQLDHIVPISKGGDNALSNCGLTCREANVAKNDMTVEEFLSLCKEVLLTHGYTISLAESSGPAPHPV